MSKSTALLYSAPSPAYSEGQADADSGVQPPRPPNAFLMYRRRMNKLLPDSQNGQRRTQGMTSREVGRMWKALSAAQRLPYELEAAEAKKEHKRQFPNYRYKPRRKEEVQQAKAEKQAERERRQQEKEDRTVRRTEALASRTRASRPIRPAPYSKKREAFPSPTLECLPAPPSPSVLDLDVGSPASFAPSPLPGATEWPAEPSHSGQPHGSPYSLSYGLNNSLQAPSPASDISSALSSPLPDAYLLQLPTDVADTRSGATQHPVAPPSKHVSLAAPAGFHMDNCGQSPWPVEIQLEPFETDVSYQLNTRLSRATSSSKPSSTSRRSAVQTKAKKGGSSRLRSAIIPPASASSMPAPAVTTAPVIPPFSNEDLFDPFAMPLLSSDMTDSGSENEWERFLPPLESMPRDDVPKGSLDIDPVLFDLGSMRGRNPSQTSLSMASVYELGSNISRDSLPIDPTLLAEEEMMAAGQYLKSGATDWLSSFSSFLSTYSL